MIIVGIIGNHCIDIITLASSTISTSQLLVVSTSTSTVCNIRLYFPSLMMAAPRTAATCTCGGRGGEWGCCECAWCGGSEVLHDCMLRRIKGEGGWLGG